MHKCRRKETQLQVLYAYTCLYNICTCPGTLFRGSRGNRLVQFLYNDMSGASDANIAIVPDMSDTEVATLVNKPHDYPHMAAVSAVLNTLLQE
jgi:hypothetical protein